MLICDLLKGDLLKAALHMHCEDRHSSPFFPKHMDMPPVNAACPVAGAASPAAQLALSQTAFLAPLLPHSVPGSSDSNGGGSGDGGGSSATDGVGGSSPALIEAEASGGGAGATAHQLELRHGGAQLPAWTAQTPSVLWLRVQAGAWNSWFDTMQRSAGALDLHGHL